MWHIADVIAALVFLFGLAIGSFLNVCIRRIPQVEDDKLRDVLRKQAKSIVSPSSRCPECKKPIRPYDNIPLLSYLVLGGRCRACGTRISPVYPTVELLSGLLFLICYDAFGFTLEGLKWVVFSSLLVILIFTDIFKRTLPDLINFSGMGFALVMSLFVPVDDGMARWLSGRLFDYPPPDAMLSLVDALLGAGAGSGLLWAVSEGYFRLRGREGMGLGDVKMMAMVGAFFGIERTMLTILGGSLVGSFLGLFYIAMRREGTDYELPFGTFLGAAALLMLFLGTPLLEWYFSISGLR